MEYQGNCIKLTLTYAFFFFSNLKIQIPHLLTEPCLELPDRVISLHYRVGAQLRKWNEFTVVTLFCQETHPTGGWKTNPQMLGINWTLGQSNHSISQLRVLEQEYTVIQSQHRRLKSWSHTISFPLPPKLRLCPFVSSDLSFPSSVCWQN